jgi:hypothetical protein
MKYVIDIDALKECLDLLPSSYSDPNYVDLCDVKKLIDRFPKDKADENKVIINTRSVFKNCQDCGNYGWDMPQCRECDASNNFKYFERKYNDND